MRSEFENWFKTTEAYKLIEEMNYFKVDLFTFKEHRSQYQHSAVQIAYMTYQHQQSKVDELQKRVDAAIYLLPSIKAENDLWGCDQVERQIELLEQALKGDQFEEHREKAEQAISNGASLTSHRIEL